MADSKRTVPPTPRPEPEPVEPPYYVAKYPLPVGAPGVRPVYAYGVGDHVPPGDVERHNWGNLVEVPEQFAGVLKAPPPAEGGQARPGAHTESEA